VYATLLDRDSAGPIVIEDFPYEPTVVRLVGWTDKVDWSYNAGALQVTLPDGEDGVLAPSFAIE
jgi:hypothetical protein